MTEAQFQAQVVQLAGLLGWSWYHTHDSRRSPAGFPDLVLWHPGDVIRERGVRGPERRVNARFLLAELKTDKGRLSPEQRDTIATMAQAGVAVHLWRPRDFDDVKAVLERRAA
jgi:hypothetical protein